MLLTLFHYTVAIFMAIIGVATGAAKKLIR